MDQVVRRGFRNIYLRGNEWHLSEPRAASQNSDDATENRTTLSSFTFGPLCALGLARDSIQNDRMPGSL